MNFETNENSQIDNGLDALAQQVEDKFLLREQFLQLIEQTDEDVTNVLDKYLVA